MAEAWRKRGCGAKKQPKYINESESSAKLELIRKQLEPVLFEFLPREQEVLRFRFGLDSYVLTLEEMSLDYFGVSVEQIRKIEASALRRLRNKGLR